jgi:DUF4097 and DUF4098 domain-containing protein YvlB
MRARWNHVTTALVLAAALLLFTVGAQAAEGTFTRTLTVTGPVDLDVSTGSGDITVRVGEPGQVQVTGKITTTSRWLGGGGEELVQRIQQNPPVQQQGNSIHIGRIEDRELRRNVSISYELWVPQETRLGVDTGSGNVDADGIQGPVNADTGSGNITLANIGGEVRTDTGSGDVRLDSINGPVFADTGSGSIRGTGVRGSLTVDTGSGDVQLEESTLSEVKVSTGSGQVSLIGVRGGLQVSTASGDITIEGEPTADWAVGASSGDITLRLSPETAFEVDARTSSGDIYTDHPLTVQGKIGRRQLRGQVRGGGVKLALSTSSGSIRIE